MFGFYFFVFPVKAGIYFYYSLFFLWIPAFAGMIFTLIFYYSSDINTYHI